MSCGTCGTAGGCGTSGGCKSGGCATGGCNKLNTFDWFGNMRDPGQNETENIYEVRFKNTRKRFYRNVNGLSVMAGDLVAVESDRGYDIGQISLTGIMAKLQMRKKGVRANSEHIRKLYRKANSEDQEKLKRAREREPKSLIKTREIVKNMRLEMKATDVEFQGDNSKAIFYYIADQRVDFRQLIKVLAEEFRIRIEMKQIGLRHEAGLVGGIGSCGRELCCSTWLTDFKTVSTATARYQNLSLNPMKISGQCGRLKCCLNFELETYLDALKDIPRLEKIETDAGVGYLQKTDIFKRMMWFCYANDTTWIPLEVHKVAKMKKMNEQGKKPVSLRALDETPAFVEKEIDFVDAVGQMDADTMILPKSKHRGKGNYKGKGKGGNQNRNQNQNRGRNLDKNPNQNRNRNQEKDKQKGEERSGNKNQERRNPRGQAKNRPQNKRNEGNSGNRNPNKNQNRNQSKPPKPPTE